MGTIKKISSHFMKDITAKRVFGVIVGNIILGIGAALLSYSLMGNEPYTAMNIAISGGLNVGLGNYQLIVNIVLLTVQLIWGRKYIGFGTIINMCLLGYIIQFSKFMLNTFLGSLTDYSIIIKVLIMLLAFVILTFGLSMYQTSALGVAPYDYVALGLTDHLHTPFFASRMIADCCCVLVIVAAVFGGLITWETSHLGVGTICGALFLGPLINFFNSIHKKWIL